MGAIGEGIMKTPFGRIQNFLQAGRTGGGIGDDICPVGSFLTSQNVKASLGWSIKQGTSFYIFYAGEWWHFGPQSTDELLQQGSRSPDPDENTFAIVEHFSLQTQDLRQSPDCGPEPYPLHLPSNPNGFTDKGLGVESLNTHLSASAAGVTGWTKSGIQDHYTPLGRGW